MRGWRERYGARAVLANQGWKPKVTWHKAPPSIRNWVSQQLLNRPNVIGNPRFHRRGNTKGLVNTAANSISIEFALTPVSFFGLASISTLKASSRTDPSKSTNSINDLCFHFARLKSLSNSVNTGERVGCITREIEAGFDQTLPQGRSSCPSVFWRTPKCIANGIGQTDRPEFILVKATLKRILLLVWKHSQCCANKLMKFCNLQVQTISGCELFPQFYELFFKKCSVIHGHRRSVRQCLIQVK